ncbi:MULTISPECIES: DNA gyrase subunit A [unclassified Enterococcus]|uniref:DNA gyrase subunit A n=1 Tax=unclassified Enterococcus TaxID=2608891 RepID=UPI001CE0627F|nr:MULTISPECIES: DNA gyrase subunit A [unclassified Enterococcus]MCA5014284.1 DNA gyrase subunit A [Enterococcus sp. S23]MCA5017695.1 DNA gyrase subunit A [Enterococcus sp. S22(2020)]
MSEEVKENIQDVNLTSEMKESFIDYAMSVIVARALPDVRDGLKPVHRRILYGMNELGVTPDKPHKKSARVVGDVMGKYHPHGDSSIYEAMVRMAQPFSYRSMLVDGHGNFGSVDGDGAAAMRYTEARMSKIALEMLRDINKDTVDFHGNYDDSEQEPDVLPARFPNLLVNGTTGIAVGMATNIPPHNLAEVIEATNLLMDNPEITTNELMEVLPGPDFPTGGLVMGKSGIRRAYETGRGSITVRAKVDITEMPNGKERILVSELPYMVNKAKLIERISELHREKRIEGITDLRDESSREGMRIVIDVRRDVSASVILNNLYKMTSLQTSFGFNMLAIEKGVPKILSLKQILENYVEHQQEVITRRTEFDKKKAEARAHILEGLRIALDHIDEIISIIRNSRADDEAKASLIERFEFSDRQAQAILDMRLRSLTGLQRDKVENEYQELLKFIADMNDILARPERVIEIIKTELGDIRDKYGDARRTELLVGEVLSLEDEDLIEEEEVVITLTNNGYIKRVANSEFRAQRRGGRGVQGMGVHDDDFVKNLVSCSTHDTLLFFTNNGKVYRAKGYEIPEYGRTAKGIPVINMLGIDSSEKIQAIIAVEGKAEDGHYLFFTTRKGTVKRTAVTAFSNIRSNGLIAIGLKEDDELVNVVLTNGEQNMIIGTHNGYSVTFAETAVRDMGRTASGVRGIRLREDDYVVGASLLDADTEVLVLTENGYGKRTKASEYPVKGRGGKGIKTANITAKNGPLAGLTTVRGDEDILVITNKGVIIRFNVDSVSQTGRATLGVRLMRMEEDAKVVTMAVVEPEPDEIVEEVENAETKVVETETTEADTSTEE